MRKRGLRHYNMPVFLILLLVSVVMIFPFIWMVLSAFKTNADVYAYPIRWLPSSFSTTRPQLSEMAITFPSQGSFSITITRCPTKGQRRRYSSKVSLAVHKAEMAPIFSTIAAAKRPRVIPWGRFSR